MNSIYRRSRFGRAIRAPRHYIWAYQGIRAAGGTRAEALLCSWTSVKALVRM